MNDKQRKTLDAISSISEKYIDEATIERIRYINDMENRGFFGRHKRIISLAASIFILVSSLITVLLILFTNRVPVYEGMTVSSEAPIINGARSGASTLSYSAPLRATALAAEFEEKTSLDSLLTERYGVADGKYDYYANKNEDVYITVHINNPSGYEILSFTLNGVKYSSYMFEDGSDLENLILKVNVGDAEDFASYTIDAIKYVDGEEVKDVRITKDKLTFTLWSPNSFSAVTKISLLNSQGNTVKTAEASADEVVFSGLTAGEYSVIISYSYDVSGRSVNDSSTAISGITCLVGAKPILAGEVYRRYSETPIWQPSLSTWREHYGVDIKPTGSDASVHAVARGVVSKVAEEQPYFGKYVIITDSFGYSYYYCSLAEIYVKEGDTVTLGDVIGTAGDTMATEVVDGVHLHLALKGPDGEYVNPSI